MNKRRDHGRGEAAISTDVVGEPAVEGLTLNRATLSDDVVYILTTRTRPMHFIAFDLATGEVTTDIDVPTGSDVAWQVGSVGGSVYFITNAPEMFRFDTSTQQLTKIDGVPSDAFTYDMAVAEDGAVYIGSGTTGTVYQYHPAEDRFSSTTWADEEPNYPSALAATSDTLFVGTSGLYRSQPGHPAELFAIDRDTGAARSILPVEMNGPNIYGLASSEDRLAASTGLTAPAQLLVMNTHDFTDYGIVQLDGEPFFDRMVVHDGAVYATGTSSGDLYEVDIDGEGLDRLATPVAGAPTRNLFVHEGRVVGVSAAGVIWTYELETGDVEVFELVAAGARGAPQIVQSFAVGADKAFVGGSNIIAVHDLGSNDSQRSLVAGGEAKAMTTAGSRLYVAMYPYGVLLEHSPQSADLVAKGSFGEGFNRPTDIHYDRDQDLVLTTVGRDVHKDGALSIYDRDTGEMKAYVDALGGASPLSVTTLGGTALVGSRDGSLVAMDSATGERAWSTIPVPGQGGITGLAADGHHVYGATEGGTVFALDVRDQSVAAEAPQAIGGSVGKVVLHGGDVYAVSSEQLVRMDAGTGQTEVVLDGLEGKVARPSLPVDDHGNMYVIDGHDLVRVQLG